MHTQTVHLREIALRHKSPGINVKSINIKSIGVGVVSGIFVLISFYLTTLIH